ncbi:DUF5615 family PIN-like protein [Dyadobacter sp. CY343]|uniref:DUF5615 family PIN-like protein n=1 Tax=Dyadobacter sp. CY343 TaxID=2907299 RepID=UPI001F42C604|nr:DUF5615 family PIN-like protein [Dyadobacter sp. CY343]MCE7059081.1 DUF5615 family PIN-like protein [Dyadobacter sp. CY343]
MNFICDVHISIKLVKYLVAQGHNAMHVNQLPQKWHTTDQQICSFADSQGLIVITKDEDFRNSFFLKRTPRKLIRITLGNVSNDDLIEIFAKNLSTIAKLNIELAFYIELGEAPVIYTF